MKRGEIMFAGGMLLRIGSREPARAERTRRRGWNESGQGTVEAAFALPILLGLVLLLVQPGILLYDRIVMEGAASEACRFLATASSADAEKQCENLARRRLGAIPQQENFHVHDGGCSWDVSIVGNEGSEEVSVSITGKAKALPLIGFLATALGAAAKDGTFAIAVEKKMPTQPDWAWDGSDGAAPDEWAGAWLS